MIDHAAFLLRADENAEMMVDAAMNVIRVTLGGKPVPDPLTITQRNMRLLILAAYKAGATFGLEEVISLAEKAP